MDAVVTTKTKTLNSFFTVSDEAFLRLCFVNYHERWKSDYRRAEAKVCVVIASRQQCIHQLTNLCLVIMSG